MGLFGDIAVGATKAVVRASTNYDKKEVSKNECNKWIMASIEEEEKIEKCYEVFVERCKKEFADIKQSETIHAILKNILQIDYISRDYSRFDQLPAKYRQSEEFKRLIPGIEKNTYKACVDAYLYHDCSVRFIMLMLKPLLYFTEIENEIKHSLKHFNYLNHKENAVRSVLTDYEDIGSGLQDIEQRLGENPEEIKETIYKLCEVHHMVSELYEKGDYQEAFNCIASVDFEESIFDDCKKFMLRLAINRNDNSAETHSYELIKKIVDERFKAGRIVCKENNGKEEAVFVRIPVVDMIIADAIKLNQAGMVDNINNQLKQFLENFLLNKDEVDAEQLEVLRKAFAYLKAYGQEKIVLEFMVLNNIPRSEMQEKRLIFLKGTGNTSSIGVTASSPERIETLEEDGKMIYDYRCLSWSDSQIKSYLNSLSNEYRVLMTPMVIDEWNNNLDVKNLNWNLNDLNVYLEKGIKNNFGNKYCLLNIEAGALAEGWIDYSESILIIENKEAGLRYPWIQFVISAEQLTLAQVAFSIFVVYNPDADTLKNMDCFQANEVIANKLIGLKQKQNPKINNYINVTKNVIISELEKYLNGNFVDDSIY